jgi:hypothetical protein
MRVSVAWVDNCIFSRQLLIGDLISIHFGRREKEREREQREGEREKKIGRREKEREREERVPNGMSQPGSHQTWIELSRSTSNFVVTFRLINLYVSLHLA